MSKASILNHKRVLSYSQCHACDVVSLAIVSLCSLGLPPDVKKDLMDFSEYLEKLATSRGGYSFEFITYGNGDFDYDYSAPANSFPTVHQQGSDSEH